MSADGMPADPVGVLAEGAAAQHELFLAYVGAGFTEEQAFRLILAIVTASIRGSLGGDS